MTGKIVIITGSSAGIGKAQAFNLLENGATVIFACRDEKKTRNVLDEVKDLPNRSKATSSCFDRAVYINLNLNSFKSVQNFVSVFKKKFDHLDVLVNNAGYIAQNFELTEDGLEASIQTNHYSHVLLSMLLLDYFNKKEGRILNVSSIAHKFSNYESTLKTSFPKDKGDQYKSIISEMVGSNTVYGNTKLANIWFTQYISNYCKEKGLNHIYSYSLHPGVVDSEFLNSVAKVSLFRKIALTIIYPIFYFLTKTNYDGAQTQLHLCYEDTSKLVNGGYYKDCVNLKSEKISYNEELREFLMKETINQIQKFMN